MAQFNFFSTAFDPREWTMVVFWKEDSRRQLRLITPENEGRGETSSHHQQDLLCLMTLMFLVVQGLVDLLINLVDLILNHKIHQILQITLDFRQDCLQLLRLVDQSRGRSRGRSRPRSPLPDPQLIHITMCDGDDDQPPQDEGQRHRSRSRERSYPHALVPQERQVQPMIIPEPVTDPDEDPTVVNVSFLTGMSPPVEQRDRSRRQQRSRSRERAPQRTLPHTPSLPSPGEPKTQPLASQDTDGESEAVEPQSRRSNRPTLLQRKANLQNQKEKKTKKEVGEVK